mmetsp:Transcript_7162/g.8228  ORF Transcript_7162/g.8228 Transcript_7162/m.8228 type:complete len:135 (-) Transcript_7162:79-483(-)
MNQLVRLRLPIKSLFRRNLFLVDPRSKTVSCHVNNVYPVATARPFSSLPAEEDITLQPEDQLAVEEFRKALESDKPGEDIESLVKNYELLLFSTREKMRLTVEWNDTTQLSQREKVERTAARVGFSMEFDPSKN